MRTLRSESDLVRAVQNSALALAAVSGAYWFSVRPWHLRWGATDAEVERRWPGDEFVPAPHTRAVRAITVNAPAGAVWPWIMQVDRERGGFYSYTWLENMIGANIHNVYHLIPGLPARRPGDTVWMAPREKFDGMGRMVVATITPERSMVLVPPVDAEGAVSSGTAEGVWAFILDPRPDGTTRLVMLSLTSKLRLPDLLLWEPAHFVMERKMMLSIKRLAEQRGPR